MIRIAIADDQEENIQTLEAIVKKYAREKDAQIQIYTYTSSTFLLADVTEGRGFDIYLLDIEMPEHTGLEVSKEIRDRYYEAFIIFVSDHNEYIEEGYEYSAFRYILRKNAKIKLPQAFDVLLPYIEAQNQKCFVVENSRGIYKVSYKDIIKIEKDGKQHGQKNVRITARNRIFTVRGSVSGIFQGLDSEDFIYINKGLVVSLKHINAVEDKYVLLDDGSTAPVSRSRIKETREAVSKFFRRGSK